MPIKSASSNRDQTSPPLTYGDRVEFFHLLSFSLMCKNVNFLLLTGSNVSGLSLYLVSHGPSETLPGPKFLHHGHDPDQDDLIWRSVDPYAAYE